MNATFETFTAEEFTSTEGGRLFQAAVPATAKQCSARERIPNGHSFNILHMEGIADELKRAGITQSEMKSDEWYSK